jgi:Reverse transcriptase (RNA-dependent DNA polymerase)
LEQVQFLEAPFTALEIRQIVFSCDPNKAPSLDEFLFQFYQAFWDLVFSDVTALVNAFYTNQLDVLKINLATTCLLPKKIDASNIKNYRPISLINYSFKIITKLLAARLATIMDYLIDSTQTAYIKGRLIMDNVVCAHEVLHQVMISKTKGFDRVNWDFLIETLTGRGFGSKWISWIQFILKGSKTCVNFNVNLGPYFHCKRGARQGDPLSPFLFDLVADVLNILLQNARHLGYLKGLDSIGSFEGILNLHFVDDTLLFVEVKAEYIEVLK